MAINDASKDNSTKNANPLSVLVIEDHPDQRDLLAIVLQREGYRVITAANGLDALNQLERENVHIVLSDIMMPKMDGFELTKKIRANPSLKAVYIILITARIQEGDRVRGLDLGADDYITKPFSFSELLARVRVGTRVVKYQRQLERQSQVDPLTGLYNRRLLQEKFQAEFERAKRYQHNLSVLILDIDNFKAINDTYGHQIGDNVLIKIAEILRAKTRLSDLPARYGGEEFLLILPETDQASALQVAAKIREDFRLSKFGSGNQTFTLTVSIGISSMSGREYANYQQMLEHADQALYLAKNRGKDRIECAQCKAKKSA